ncbi:MAG: hypothetical protein IK088_05380 [Lachnospiraceae bacterium]|nr:hypothetical protein [Lachnospiraceae bacterium]
MAEKLYTIPVNDAFDADSECPVCYLYRKLEKDALEFTLGPSYMEDDVRMETDDKGFCTPHLRMLLPMKNRLGLSLILKTHIDADLRKASALSKKTIKPASILKKQEKSELALWTEKEAETCFVCDRIAITFPHYLDTIVKLYKKDEAFRSKYETSKGFCRTHFGMLIEAGRREFSGDLFKRFTDETIRLYTDGLKRLSEDLDWFQNKFDYRYKDAPWKDSKDAIERAVVKTNSVYELPDGRNQTA